MTRKEFTKICMNRLSSLTVTVRSRTLRNYNQGLAVKSCHCFSNRHLSTARTLFQCVGIRQQIANDTLSPTSNPGFPSSTNFNSCKIYSSGSFLCRKHYTVSTDASEIPGKDFMEFSDPGIKNVIEKDMKVIFDFVSEEEENNLCSEVEPYLRRLRYENSHWDDAIHGYRETERQKWTEKNKKIIQRVRDTAFPPGTPQLAYVHVLDLQKEGYIKPHVDAVKFCGSTIAGISLLSPCIMRLVHTEDKTKYADILLERRSLYIMKDAARYDYTHEVLPDNSLFKGKSITKDRRISVICRNEP